MKGWLILILLLVGARCAGAHEAPTPTSLPTVEPAFRSGGRRDPRSSSYWVRWSSCGPDSQAEVAAANGGREAGWIILDDLLADPGIQIGDYRLPACEQGVALLQGRTAAGAETNDPVYALARQLLAAELNLNAGAESCPAAEEAVLGAHLVLASVGFQGSGAYSPQEEVAAALPQLSELLTDYNSGALCR